MQEDSIRVLKTLNAINSAMEKNDVKGIAVVSDDTHNSIINVGVQYSDGLTFKDKTVMIRSFIDDVLNIDCDNAEAEITRKEFLKLISSNVMETKDINVFEEKYLP